MRVAITAAGRAWAVGMGIAVSMFAGGALAQEPSAAPQIIYPSSAPQIIYPASVPKINHSTATATAIAASAPRTASTLPGSQAASIGSAESPAWRFFLTVAEYTAPVIALLLVGGLFWWVRVRRQRTGSPSIGDSELLASLNPRDFEMLIINAFIAQGYQVSQTSGGVDLVLRKARETSLLQCKHWKRAKVEVKALRELLTVMNARGAAVGIIVTAGRFSREAHDFAERHNLKLIDGPVLGPMIRHAHAARSRTDAAPLAPVPTPAPISIRTAQAAAAPAAFAAMSGAASDWPASLPEHVVTKAPTPMRRSKPRTPVAPREGSLAETVPALSRSATSHDRDRSASQSAVKLAAPPIGVSSFVDTEPPCPVCGSGMVLRTVKRGSRAGRVVWSCVNFPSCRGVRKADRG